MNGVKLHLLPFRALTSYDVQETSMLLLPSTEQ